MPVQAAPHNTPTLGEGLIPARHQPWASTRHLHGTRPPRPSLPPSFLPSSHGLLVSQVTALPPSAQGHWWDINPLLATACLLLQPCKWEEHRSWLASSKQLQLWAVLG